MEILENISDKEYNKLEGVRSTVLKKIITEPTLAHAKYEIDNFKGNENTLVGNCIDLMLFDKENYQNHVYVLPASFTKRSDANKEFFARVSNEFDYVVTTVQQELVDNLYKAFFKNKELVHLYDNITHRQLVVKFEWMGLSFKVKIDAVSNYKNKFLLPWDLKSIACASDDFFKKQVVNFGYDVQEQIYLKALNIAEIIDHEVFAFLLVEKKSPNLSRIVELDFGAKEFGEARLLKSIKLYKEAVKNGWAGYSENISTISLSHWDLQKINNEELFDEVAA